MFQEIFPIISTPDMDRALAFYRDLLGAHIEYQFPPEGDPGYVALDLGSSHLGIGLQPDVTPGESDRFALWVYADDCDAAVARLRSAGVEVLQEPVDQPWGEHTAIVADPDGNRVHIGTRE